MESSSIQQSRRRTQAEPLTALAATTLALRITGAVGIHRLRPWPLALRGGLATMFMLTGMAHFIGLRAELISMVPPAMPNPGLLVTITGLLELAGAVGLLLRPTAPWAAGGLAAGGCRCLGREDGLTLPQWEPACWPHGP